MDTTDTPLVLPDRSTANRPTEIPFKQEQKERSKTHIRAGITKNKGCGLSKTRRAMSRNSRRINRRRG